MHCVSSCELPVFGIKNFDYGSVIKSVDFHFAPLQNLMSTLPYPHRHDFYHIVWIQHGTGHHIIDSVKYKVQPNTLFFMSPGQIHDFALSTDTTGLQISFSTEFFALELQGKNLINEIPFFGLENKIQALYLNDSQANSIYATLSAIEEEYSEDRSRANDVIRSYLYILLVKASRLTEDVTAADSSRRALVLARRFNSLLENRFASIQHVGEYAHMLRVTERSLNEATRRALGSTAAQLIRARLILEAKCLLVHSEISVAAVAESLSFDDPAYFSRCFKKHTGRSPLEFRQSLAKLGGLGVS